MNKKGMTFITLVITIIVLIILGSAIIGGIEDSGIIGKAEKAVTDMDESALQQMANIAYANIYFDNLTKGIRRDLTAEEIRQRMIKNGADAQKLATYEITVKDGDVYVKPKGEK